MNTEQIITYLHELLRDSDGLLSYSQRQALAWAIAKLEHEITRCAHD